MNSPFRTLAGYIGVFGDPKNEGKEALAMTAPVAMDKKQGTAIAMTAPVAMEKDADTATKRMKFFLPAEYDDMSKIPKPTDPAVKIEEVPPAVGAVHRYNGSFSDSINEQMALALAAQLREDGIDRMSDDYVKDHFQFWGFNPPFTIPYFRRNEVWIELTPEEAQKLQGKFEPTPVEE